MGVTEQTLQKTIDSAWQRAKSAQQAAENYASQAVSAASVFLSNYGEGYQLNVENINFDASVNKVLSDIATETSTTLRGDIPDAYDAIIRNAIGNLNVDSIYGGSGDGYNAVELISTLSRAFDSAFNFDNDINQLKSFLLGGLSGEYGLPVDVENQLQARFDDKAAKQQAQAEQEAVSAFAARGFPLPPGTMAARIDEARDEAIVAKASASRDVYIDQAKRGFEAQQAYIQAFVSLQQGVSSTFVDFLKTVTSARTSMEETVRTMTDAIVKLRGAVIASYTFAVQQRAQALQEAVEEGKLTMEQRRIDLENFRSTAENTAKAAMAAAKTMGDLAAAAVGSQNTMATIAYETIAQDSGGG